MPVASFEDVDPGVISVPSAPVTPVTPSSTTIFVPGVSIFESVAPSCAFTSVTVPLPVTCVPAALVEMLVTVPVTSTAVLDAVGATSSVFTVEPSPTTTVESAAVTLMFSIVAPSIVTAMPEAATSTVPTLPSIRTSSEPSSI